MSKYIISWDAGFGIEYEVVEVEDHDAAIHEAYEAWREEAESNAIYDSKEWTEELAEEYGLKE